MPDYQHDPEGSPAELMRQIKARPGWTTKDADQIERQAILASWLLGRYPATHAEAAAVADAARAAVFGAEPLPVRAVRAIREGATLLTNRGCQDGR
jgi:hypothetical protein